MSTGPGTGSEKVPKSTVFRRFANCHFSTSWDDYCIRLKSYVTSKIIERLEEGVLPWRKCWMSGPAKSLTTGKEYRGINSVLLGIRRRRLISSSVKPRSRRTKRG